MTPTEAELKSLRRPTDIETRNPSVANSEKCADLRIMKVALSNIDNCSFSGSSSKSSTAMLTEVLVNFMLVSDDLSEFSREKQNIAVIQITERIEKIILDVYKKRDFMLNILSLYLNTDIIILYIL